MDLAAFLQRKASSVSIELLAPEHYHILVQAIRNVLSTEVAELTMAQLVDGLPLASSGWDARGTLLLRDHPLTRHETLCDGALEQTEAFREAFDPAILHFDSPVVQAYQNSETGSWDFKMRLVELVAVTIHQIAVLLFKLQPKLHIGDIDSVVSWKEESKWVTLEGGRRIFEERLFEPRPTLFFHVDYMDYDQYPDGLADIAGYWAEDRIFGGVVLFNRGESGLECKDVYFHSGRKRTTFRVWRLLESQFNSFVEFLTSDTPLQSSPFPILASDENLHRYDPWDAIAQHHIFRDPWERNIPLVKPGDTRDVRNTGDYPELASMFIKLQEAYEPRPELESSTTHRGDPLDCIRRPSSVNEEPLYLQQEKPVVDQNESANGDDETNSLYFKTPPQSPVLSAADDTAETGSLGVRTPPKSPVLSLNCSNLGDDGASLVAEREDTSGAWSPTATDNTEVRTDRERRSPAIRVTDPKARKRKISEISDGQERS